MPNVVTARWWIKNPRWSTSHRPPGSQSDRGQKDLQEILVVKGKNALRDDSFFLGCFLQQPLSSGEDYVFFFYYKLSWRSWRNHLNEDFGLIPPWFSLPSLPSQEGTAGCCGSEQAAFSCRFGLGAVQSRASPCLGAQQAGAAPQAAGRMGPAAWHGQQVAPSFPQLASSLFIEALS